MPSLVATTSTPARKPFVRTHYVRTNKRVRDKFSLRCHGNHIIEHISHIIVHIFHIIVHISHIMVHIFHIIIKLSFLRLVVGILVAWLKKNM